MSYMCHMKNINRISLRLPTELHNNLKTEGKTTGNGISSIIRSAIKEHIDRMEKTI